MIKNNLSWYKDLKAPGKYLLMDSEKEIANMLFLNNKKSARIFYQETEMYLEKTSFPGPNTIIIKKSELQIAKLIQQNLDGKLDLINGKVLDWLFFSTGDFKIKDGGIAGKEVLYSKPVKTENTSKMLITLSNYQSFNDEEIIALCVFAFYLPVVQFNERNTLKESLGYGALELLAWLGLGALG